MEIAAIENQHMKLVRKLRKSVWQVQEKFELIESGDLVMACLSGGKDSYTLLDMLLNIQRAREFDFEIIAVNLDQKQPGFPKHVLPEYLENMKVQYRILEKDTYSIVLDKLNPGQTMCSLCSRLRRGTLYEFATEIGATKIALGHHREDVLETFMMNLFFSGKLESMPPKFITDDGKHTVIRPLVYCKEEDIIEYSKLREFPIIPCNLCGSQPNLQRAKIKEMMLKWDEEFPDRKEIMLTALHNVHPSHLFDVNLEDVSKLFVNK